MGHLIYGASQEFEFEDRVLAHLKITITAKLRHQESFLMSWVNPPETGSGRVSLWLSPSIPLVFKFAGSRGPELNQHWIAAMSELSHTQSGLRVISEHEAEAYIRQKREE
ncbi:MAG: hypothetical protein WAS54_00765 [Scrofimicrobium sp.]